MSKFVILRSELVPKVGDCFFDTLDGRVLVLLEVRQTSTGFMYLKYILNDKTGSIFERKVSSFRIQAKWRLFRDGKEIELR